MSLTIDTAAIHPSTDATLEAFGWLQERYEFGHVLDMGCGNGILSAAASAIWGAEVLAVDISDKALKDAEENLSKLDSGLPITLLKSDGFAHPAIRQKAPYNLIICNLVAELLVRMARDVTDCLAPEGVLVLSGSLAWMVDDTKRTYQALGFEIIHEIVKNPWHTLVLAKPVTKASL